MSIHPYYLDRAQRLLTKLDADIDADPKPLAAWAQSAHGDQLTFITRDGNIVAHGHFTHDEPTVAYMDKEPRLPGAGMEAKMAANMLASHLHQPVRIIYRSEL